MIPRVLVATLALYLAAVPAIASSAAPSKTKSAAKAASNPKTWKSMAEYIFKNGSDRAFKGSRAVKLGYETNIVAAKAMRLKSSISPDKRERALFIVYEKNSPKEIIIAETHVTERQGGKYVEGFDYRVNLSGKLISALYGSGLAGATTVSQLDVESPNTKSAFKTTTEFILKTMNLEHLSQ